MNFSNLFLTLLFSVASTALRAEEKTSSFSSGVNTGSLLQTLLGLILVVASIFVVVWLLKRSQMLSGGAHRQLRVIGGISLGARERAVLVQVGNEQILLGVTPQQVRTLHVLPEPLESPQASDKNGNFAEKLREMMQRGQT